VQSRENIEVLYGFRGLKILPRNAWHFKAKFFQLLQDHISKIAQTIDPLNNFNHINIRVNESLKIKALIDLEPISSKNRGSPKVESRFHSSHKKTRSESSASITLKHTVKVFSTFHSTNKRPNLKTDRLPTNTVSNAPSRSHTRQNS
jgi:hypothetical protein